MFLGRRDIPSCQVSYRCIHQQKNVLWIEFDRLRVKLCALFPLSLPARHTTEIFRGYSVVWILPANRFELGLGAFKITFEEIFVKTICQLRLDQFRPELHGHVESLAREVTSLRCYINIINEHQAVLAGQMRPRDGEFRIKLDCLFECLYRFCQGRTEILDSARESQTAQVSVVGVRIFCGTRTEFSLLVPAQFRI